MFLDDGFHHGNRIVREGGGENPQGGSGVSFQHGLFVLSVSSCVKNGWCCCLHYLRANTIVLVPLLLESEIATDSRHSAISRTPAIMGMRRAGVDPSRRIKRCPAFGVNMFLKQSRGVVAGTEPDARFPGEFARYCDGGAGADSLFPIRSCVEYFRNRPCAKFELTDESQHTATFSSDNTIRNTFKHLPSNTHQNRGSEEYQQRR